MYTVYAYSLEDKAFKPYVQYSKLNDVYFEIRSLSRLGVLAFLACDSTGEPLLDLQMDFGID